MVNGNKEKKNCLIEIYISTVHKREIKCGSFDNFSVFFLNVFSMYCRQRDRWLL